MIIAASSPGWIAALRNGAVRHPQPLGEPVRLQGFGEQQVVEGDRADPALDPVLQAPPLLEADLVVARAIATSARANR